MAAFALDKRKKPKRARLLLTRGRMHRRHPFTIFLQDRVGGDVQPVRVKIDPGSNTTGVAIITEEDGNKPAKVLCLFELARLGRQISEVVTARRAFRRRRRGANLRYPAPRFDNRTGAKGWLVRCACVYCGVCSLRVQIEHVISRARGGSNRVSNLTAAGAPCNPEKGARPVEEFKLLHPRTALCLAVRLSSPG